MTLRELRATLTRGEWNELAAKVGSTGASLTNYAYNATHRPSALRAKALVAADPRLTLHELRPDIWD